MLKAETVIVWSERVGEADFNKNKQVLNVGYKQKQKDTRKTRKGKEKHRYGHRELYGQYGIINYIECLVHLNRTLSPHPTLVWLICAGVNTMTALKCGQKQQHRDPLEELVSVRFQMNSRAVCLWRECDPTVIRPYYHVNIASLS